MVIIYLAWWISSTDVLFRAKSQTLWKRWFRKIVLKYLCKKFHTKVVQGKVYSNCLPACLLSDVALYMLLLKRACSDKDTAEESKYTLENKVFDTEEILSVHLMRGMRDRTRLMEICKPHNQMIQCHHRKVPLKMHLINWTRKNSLKERLETSFLRIHRISKRK